MNEFDALPWTSEGAPSEAGLLGNREDRRTVELTAYLIRSNKQILDVKVIDLSYDGCAIRTWDELAAGEQVKLSVLGRGAINASVRWYKGRMAGLLFEPERAVRPHWPRRSERIAVEGEALLRRPGRVNYRVRVFDLSRFGCKCEYIERPTIYERAWIKFDGLESLESTVSWIEGSEVGLFYRNPLHAAVFSLLLDRTSIMPKPISPAGD